MKVVKNGRSKVYAMNGAALSKIFAKNGINPRQIGVEFGYHATYFPKCIRNNSIGEKAVGFLMSKGITPSQYGVEFTPYTPAFEAKHKKYTGEIMKEIEKKVDSSTSSTVGEVLDELDKKENPNVARPINRNSGRYPWGEEKSPVEQAVEEPGVVKVEFTLDIVKLKAIIKQAVKEAYEEL